MSATHNSNSTASPPLPLDCRAIHGVPAEREGSDKRLEARLCEASVGLIQQVAVARTLGV